LDADHQASATHGLDVRMPDRRDLALEPCAELRRALDQVLIFENIQCGARDGTAERIAAESAAVRTCAENAQDFPTRNNRGNRIETTCQRLSEDVNVGLHIFVIAREHATGAAQSRLDLVGHEEDIVRSTEI